MGWHFPDLVTGSTLKEIPSTTDSKPSAVKKKKLTKIRFPACYWVALDQQKSAKSKKEFGSEVKLRDACSHVDKQLKNVMADQQDRKVQAMMAKQNLQACFPEEFAAR